MATKLYPSAKKKFLDGDIDLLSDTIRAVLVDAGTYTYSDSHESYDDLSGVVGSESGAFAGKSTTGGVFDANDIAFSAVTGSTAEAIVIFKDSGTASTDWLIAYIDDATGLPVTPNGGDINVAWDNGSNKIFAI